MSYLVLLIFDANGTSSAVSYLVLLIFDANVLQTS